MTEKVIDTKFIKGAIFDMDGTLIDSMPMWDTVGERFLNKKGIAPKDGLREDLLPLSQKQSARYFIEKYGVKGTIEEIEAEINDTVRSYFYNESTAKDGAADILKILKEKGLGICVATATDKDMATAALKRNGLMQYIDDVFTCDSIGKGKEEPDIFLLAMENMGTEASNTIVFEDALYAIVTAKKLGIKTVALYDAASEFNNAEIKNTADMYFESLKEVIEVIL